MIGMLIFFVSLIFVRSGYPTRTLFLVEYGKADAHHRCPSLIRYANQHAIWTTYPTPFFF